MRRVFSLVMLAASLSACPRAPRPVPALAARSGDMPRFIDWQRNLNIRGSATGAGVEPIRPHARHAGLSMRTVFLRNVPNVRPGATVVVGFEIKGLLPNGEVIATVGEPVETEGKDGAFVTKNVFGLFPTVYDGQEVTVTLHVRELDASRVEEVRARIAKARPGIRALNPLTADLAEGRRVFGEVMGTSPAEKAWRHSFSLTPLRAEGPSGDTGARMLLSGPMFLVLFPHPKAHSQPLWAELLKEMERAANVPISTSQDIVQNMQLRGGAPHWKSGGSAFRELPYIALTVDAYARGLGLGNRATSLLKMLKGYAEAGSAEAALFALKELSAALAAEPQMTASEKALTRLLGQVHQAELEAVLARKNGDVALEGRMLVEKARRMKAALSDFPGTFDGPERGELKYQLEKLLKTLSDRGLALP